MNSNDSSITDLIAAHQALLSSTIIVSAAAKQIDANGKLGEAAVSLLDEAVQLSKEAGQGGKIDSVA